MKHFFKCFACLEPYVLETPSKNQPEPLKACPWCEYDGAPDYMGFVHQSNQVLAKEKTACPCDARCTGATGPSCDCQCGGENHGSNMVVTFDEKLGAVPKLPKPGLAEKAKKIRAEWEAAVAQIRPLMAKANDAKEKVYQQKQLGQWVPNTEFQAFYAANGFLKSCRKAIHGLVHKTRIANMAKLREGGFPLTKNATSV